MNKVCVFPGQGSQKLGMCKTFYDNFKSVSEIFERASDFLHYDLSDVIFNDEEKLNKTIFSQVAIMTVSYAIFDVLNSEFGVKITDFKYALGHSLGEYSALAVTNALSFEETLHLLNKRSHAMENALPNGLGGMMAVLGLSVDQIKELDLGDVEIANDNSELQVVLSGMNADLDNLKDILLKHGAKKVVKLNVSGPFHSSYMESVKNVLKTENENLKSKKNPLIPIIQNVTAKPETDINIITKNLELQVVTGVRWRESVLSFKNLSVDSVLEIGNGTVLSGLCKRIDRNLNVFNVEKIEDIENLKNNHII